MARQAGRACRAAAFAGLSLFTSCTSAGDSGISTIGRIFMAGPTVPPPMTMVNDARCPPVRISEGGAALQERSSQITLGQLARECNTGPNGTVVVKIGLEGRIILGAGAASGRYDVPVRFLATHGSSVVASRVRRTAVTVPPGEIRALFTVVEEGIVVPAEAAESFELEAGLGTGEPKRRG